MVAALQVPSRRMSSPPSPALIVGLGGEGSDSQKQLLATLQYAHIHKHTVEKLETLYHLYNYIEEKSSFSLIAFHVVVSDFFFPDNCSQACFFTHLLERQLRHINSSFFPGECSPQGMRREAHSLLCFFFILYRVSFLLVQTSSV